MQPLLELRGQVRGVGVEQEVDLREVVRLDDACAVDGLALSSTNGFSLTALSLLGSRMRKAGWRASMPLSMTAQVRSRQEMANRRRAASALMASVDRDTVGAASRFRLTE